MKMAQIKVERDLQRKVQAYLIKGASQLKPRLSRNKMLNIN